MGIELQEDLARDLAAALACAQEQESARTVIDTVQPAAATVGAGLDWQ